MADATPSPPSPLPPYGHQPRIAFGPGVRWPVEVREPETSRVFYGILADSGAKDAYVVRPPPGKPFFRLHVQLLVPAITATGAQIGADGLRATIRRGDSREPPIGEVSLAEMEPFYEPFSKRLYFQATQDFNQVVSSATSYRVTVSLSGPGTQIRYAVAFGDLELFPPEELAALPKTTATLERDYFQGPSPPAPSQPRSNLPARSEPSGHESTPAPAETTGSTGLWVAIAALIFLAIVFAAVLLASRGGRAL